MSLANYRCVSPWLLPALLPKDHGARARVTAAYYVNRLLRLDGVDERTRTADPISLRVRIVTLWVRQQPLTYTK